MYILSYMFQINKMLPYNQKYNSDNTLLWYISCTLSATIANLHYSGTEPLNKSLHMLLLLNILC